MHQSTINRPRRYGKISGGKFLSHQYAEKITELRQGDQFGKMELEIGLETVIRVTIDCRKSINNYYNYISFVRALW